MNEVEWDIKKFMTFSFSNHMASFPFHHSLAFIYLIIATKIVLIFTTLLRLSFAAHASLLARNGAEIT